MWRAGCFQSEHLLFTKAMRIDRARRSEHGPGDRREPDQRRGNFFGECRNTGLFSLVCNFKRGNGYSQPDAGTWQGIWGAFNRPLGRLEGGFLD